MEPEYFHGRTSPSFTTRISFKGLERSEAVESRILQKIAKLERFHDRIIDCHVIVEAPHVRHYKGNVFGVRIDLKIGNGDLHVDRDPAVDPAHTDVYVAIRDAFNALTRQLEENFHRTRGS